jgi:cytochrome c oxidase cbb3-type subunit I/II
MIPTFLIKENIPQIESVKPYTPLELQGRDIYVREGCYNCHSQMIRPFRAEVTRFGEYSKAGEFIYDHPFQWGSKRTGPDLAREGNPKSPQYKNAAWHYQHMINPGDFITGSIMPQYPWLYEQDINIGSTNSKIHAMRKIGVPYDDGYEAIANDDLKAQAKQIAATIKQENPSIQNVDESKEIIALIAYLQRLGRDINNAPATTGNGVTKN